MTKKGAKHDKQAHEPDSPPAETAAEATPELPAPAEAGEDLAAKAAEYLEGWQRALAELANYRKRTERERAQWQATLNADLLIALLPVLDDFDRAFDNLPAEPAQYEEWANGIRLIHRKLHGQLEQLGLQEVAAEGTAFDPEVHEAVTHETSDNHEPGQVIAVLRKGYRLDDRVLRPALVRVAS